MTQLIDLLSTFVWANGAIVMIAGCFYLYAVSKEQPQLTQPERQRITSFLGLSMPLVGPSEIATGWARGLIRYLTAGGDPSLGWAVLGLRIVTTVVLLIALFDAVLTWRRASARVEAGDKRSL